MKKLLSATCLLLACQAVHAGDTKPLPAAAAKAGPTVQIKNGSGSAADTGSKSYTLSKKSVFSAPATAHNPFWPIGWVKVESATADSAAPVIPKPGDFSVTSILLNEPPMAVINGRDMAEGEIAPISLNGQTVMVQLMAVQDGRVILRWENQNLVVPLHRQEEITVTDQPATALR